MQNSSAMLVLCLDTEGQVLGLGHGLVLGLDISKPHKNAIV